MSLSLENQHPVIICTYTDMTDKPRLGWIKWRVVREQPFFLSLCQLLPNHPFPHYCLERKISTITFPLKKLIPSSILRKQLATIPTGSATRQDLVLQTRPLPSFPPPQHIILGSMEEAHPPVIPHTLMENLLQNFQIT